ncbi:MAG TPA: glycosyltransferase family 4 protein, partial [Tepidisphaeraceae bacterium]|nr:glycosyltransferase family 4 protein [Tepidisphaeraceae bacterium]
MRVLIVAYRCSPYQGSEAGVGWGWAVMMARAGHEVTVLVGDVDRDDVARFLQTADPVVQRMRFVFVRRRRMEWLERVFHPAYLWTYGWGLEDAYRVAKRLHAKQGFDLVHQCTYVGFRVPGHLWKLGVPFVWGPIGGLENTPWRFLREMGWYGATYYTCYNTINTLQKWLLPGPKRAMRIAGRAGGLIAATEGIRREIRRWYGQESRVVCEIGPPGEVATSITEREPGDPLRIAWSGLHLPGKALPLLLRGLAGLGQRLPWQLTVLGTGPLTTKWQRLARGLGIADRIEWTGKLPRDEAVRKVHEAHVFAITSLKDLTSTVLLEALSQGVPVVCPDHCGFSNVVTPECGIKVRMEHPRQLERDIAEAIAELGEDEARRRRLAWGALERIGGFAWEEKAREVEAVYREVLKE